MKKAVVFLSVTLILTGPALAGVVKKGKSEIAFRGFGKFGLTSSDKLTADKRWTDSLSDFKGQGIAGSLAGKTILRSGNTGEIIDLPASSIYRLDNKKKEYTVSPIKPLSAETAGEAREKPQEAEEKPAESKVKITRNEFKVEDTGEESVINNFPVRKYLVHWILEWEDTETGEKGASNLESLVWTTPMNDTLRAAQEEEFKFSKAYLEKLGVGSGEMQQDVLGTKWLGLLDSFSPGSRKPERDVSKFASEMEKIKGYPILIDGKYDATGQKPGGASAEQSQDESSKDVRGRIGGFLKKSLKKPKEPEAQGPALTYRMEVLEVSTADLGAADFQVPPTYKKKG
ncbi:MAG: hypothetical protein AB1715_06280 [Acidobacteriota bacterium]